MTRISFFRPVALVASFALALALVLQTASLAFPAAPFIA
jgi:hypothetical protein